MNKFEIDPLWRLAESVSLQDAVALIARYNPSAVQASISDMDFHENFPQYYPVHTAVSNAVRAGKLNAEIRYHSNPYDGDQYPEGVDEAMIPTIAYYMHDDMTTVDVNDICIWLESRGVKSGFFFPDKNDAPDYLDPNHACYSLKLAASIHAWQAVTTESKYQNNGKSVKVNIEKWLEAHAAAYGLVKEDGESNEDAIKNQISKVANWEMSGGAPKSPKR